jgi:uncharacterized protein (TIGR02466 family)
MIHNIFPTPVGRYKLSRDLTEEELSFIKSQESRANMGNLTSNDSMILDKHPMTKLRDFIESHLFEYFTTIYDPKYGAGLKITQSWINFTEPGQYHHKHAHSNSLVSGVFYPQAKGDVDKIIFYSDEYRQINLVPNEWNLWNSDSWWFNVGTGDLILFPSSLSHMVETVTDKDTRISLSFNTFPVGQVGDDFAMSELTPRRTELNKQKP